MSANEQLHNRHWATPGVYRQRMAKKQLMAILLENTLVMVNGKGYEVVWKHVGLGVYEVWLKEKEYD